MTSDALLLSVAMAVAAGLVGCFAVMRRMALAADALSHVALPGIGVALALHIHPMFGAVAMLFFGALLVWALEERTRVATETVIGVVFSAALAVGSMMTSGEDLIEALFGGPAPSAGRRSPSDSSARERDRRVFVITQRNSSLSRSSLPTSPAPRASTSGGSTCCTCRRSRSTVALGLRYLGVLLMGALIIIPAATAKRLGRT